VRARTTTVVAALIVAWTGGCAGTGGGAQSGGDAKAPADAVGLLRQDVDRLRAELAELRTLVETAQRTGIEHADRAAVETRSEMDAIQKVLEASARHDLQRQVEVLDAQARRIDVLDKRAAEQGQVLRQVELALTGIESQLARVLENPPASSGRGARPAGPARAPAAKTPEEAGSSASSDPSPAPAGAAGANLSPPAMLGLARAPRSPAPAAGPEAKPEPASPRPAATSKAPSPPSAEASPGAKPVETARDTPAAPSARPMTTDAARSTKAAPSAGEAKAAPPERSPAEAPSREPKTRPPAPRPAGSSAARELYARAMQSWERGERGQAVLDFEDLVQRFPADPLVAAAQFRIGEAYYAARDFERAALGYRRAVELDPTGKETPQALLRLGLAYRAQKREADARQAWSQLVRDFPESDVAEEARRALRGR
jgi:TolA-binding protein